MESPPRVALPESVSGTEAVQERHSRRCCQTPGSAGRGFLSLLGGSQGLATTYIAGLASLLATYP